MAMEMAVESMEMDSGGTSPSRQGARTENSIPRTWLRDGGGYRTFHGGRPIDLGFSRWGLYIDGRAASEGSQGPHTIGPRGLGATHACGWCGRPLAGLWSFFGFPGA
jgi:hypothetical protein